jgi:hypothetical protein
VRDYTVVIQLYTHSMHPNAEDAMTDFDTLIDNIKTRLRSDHNSGDTTGTSFGRAQNRGFQARYGEPATSNEGATETYAGARNSM